MFQKIYKHELLRDDELETIIDKHKLIHFKKGDFIFKAGQVSNEYFCIKSGLIRTFLYDYNGIDITTDFISADCLAIDVLSLFHRTPAQENYQALTDIEAYVIKLDAFQELYHSIKGFNEWGRAWMVENLFQLKQRSLSMISDSAKQRYIKLQDEHPEILLEAPLKFIASYLGITDTSLSRIRKELTK